MYRESNDMTRLRRHALNWISAAMASGSRLPPDPFQDLQLVKRSPGGQAIPEATVQNLLEALDSGNPHLPTEAFLDALRDDWDTHAGTVAGGSMEIRDWIESRATACHQNANWPAYAIYQLYAARLYEMAGRMDSADARRIQVIQSVDPALLGESALFTTARTAHAYDFPERQALLERFLVRFPDSLQRPDALFLLAGIRRAEGDTDRAASLLGEIRTAWPDAGIYRNACLRMAAWHMEDGAPGAALDILAALLDLPRLAPGMAAEALLLRARADFRTGRPERGVLNVFRILNLYPDFRDISESALNLVLEHLKSLDDPRERSELAARLRATAPEDVLAKFQFTEA
jgi:tetratricopeptide (TPR) repeat protein